MSWPKRGQWPTDRRGLLQVIDPVLMRMIDAGEHDTGRRLSIVEVSRLIENIHRLAHVPRPPWREVIPGPWPDDPRLALALAIHRGVSSFAYEQVLLGNLAGVAERLWAVSDAARELAPPKVVS